eukprot:403357026
MQWDVEHEGAQSSSYQHAYNKSSINSKKKQSFQPQEIQASSDGDQMSQKSGKSQLVAGKVGKKPKGSEFSIEASFNQLNETSNRIANSLDEFVQAIRVITKMQTKLDEVHSAVTTKDQASQLITSKIGQRQMVNQQVQTQKQHAAGISTGQQLSRANISAYYPAIHNNKYSKFSM